MTPKRFRTTLITAAVTAGAVAFASAGPARADWKAEWKKTVAAANKEGSVIMLVPPSNTQRGFLTREWPKAYPKIKLNLITITGGQFIQRIRIERKEHKYLWDLALSGSVTVFAPKNDGFTDPMRPEFILPEVKDPKVWGGWDRVFYDKEGKYSFAMQNFLKMPFFNAKLLSPAKVKAEGKKIFLDPALKGRIVWHDPLIPGSGESFAPVFRSVLGDDGLKKFVQDQVVFLPNMMDMVDKMARGQYAICMGPVMTKLLIRYKKAGLKLDIRPLGNTPQYAAYSNTGGENMVVIKNRPHPNATRVFINWILSKKVAYGLAKAMGQDSTREDLPSVAPPDQRRVKGAKYLEPQREVNHPGLFESHKVIRKFRDEVGKS